jgi:predicted phosphodiesterase
LHRLQKGHLKERKGSKFMSRNMMKWIRGLLVVGCVLAMAVPAGADLPTLASSAFDWKYEMDLKPSETDLDGVGGYDFDERLQNSAPSPTVSGGILTMDTGANPAYNASYKNGDSDQTWQRDPDITYANGWTFEVRVKAISSRSRGFYFFGCAEPGEEQPHAWLGIRSNGQDWGEPVINDLGAVDNASAFHVFRVAQMPNEASFAVWRDNALLSDQLTNGCSSAADALSFGDAGYTWGSLFKIDYMRFTPGAYAPDGTPPPPELVRAPYLQNATTGSVDVMWGSSVTDGTLHWGTSVGDYAHTVASTAFADTQGNYVHKASISGLTPGETAYYYISNGDGSVGQDDASYRATAAPAGNASFRFVAYGDSRDAWTPEQGHEAPWGHPDVINTMIPHAPEIVLHMGDIVTTGTLVQYNEAYFPPTAPLAKNTPVFTAIGNHELYDDPQARNYRDVYSLPTNSADGTEDYYSFDYGCVHFTVLDSELLPSGVTGHVSTTRAAQQMAWLEDDLDAATKPWKIVFFHRPIYTSDVEDAWLETFEEKGVDLVLQGHVHEYGSYYRNGVHYVTTGGGGAELYDLSTEWPDYRLEMFSDWHFVQIDASLGMLKIEVYDVNDVLRHTFLIPGDVIPGDANGDDVVDDADASILAAHWQQTGMSWEHGDFNDDGVVDDEDASILAAHWQETRDGGDPVPEPSTLVLLAGGLLWLLVRRAALI